MLDDLPFTWSFSRLVQNREDARREVGRLAHEGVPFIKVHHRIHPEALKQIVLAAEEAGLEVSVRLGQVNVTAAIEAGVRCIESLPHLLEPSWVYDCNPDVYQGPDGQFVCGLMWISPHKKCKKRLTD